MLHFRGEVSLFSQNQIGLWAKKDCALLVAPIVALSACRFYMKFFRVCPWRLFCMQVKLVSDFENKEQVIRFRLYGKSATNAQTDGDG